MERNSTLRQLTCGRSVVFSVKCSIVHLSLPLVNFFSSGKMLLEIDKRKMKKKKKIISNIGRQ